MPTGKFYTVLRLLSIQSITLLDDLMNKKDKMQKQPE